MQRRIRSTSDSGSIIVAVSIAVVATGLIVALLFAVTQGLAISRRSGDSANALQVADAGVNDAVTEVARAANTPGATFTRTSSVGSGSYTYTATRDTYLIANIPVPVWHIDALGTDKTGVKRRVQADAVSEGVFSHAIFVVNVGDFGAGLAVDSYVSGESLDAMCTGKGAVGSNDPGNLNFGPSSNGQPNNAAHNNCKDNALLTNPWQWPADACIAYGPPSMTQPYPPAAGTNGHCPTIRTSPGTYPGTWKSSPPFRPAIVRAPTGNGPEIIRANDFTCSGARKQGNNDIPASPLLAGRVYVLNNITLLDGCVVSGGDPTTADTESVTQVAAGGAKVFVSGNVTFGGSQGDDINQPPSLLPTGDERCGATGHLDEPNSNYCPGWAKTLQIYKVGAGTVEFLSNGMRLWGVVHNAQGATSFQSPQMEIWGALTSGSVGGSGNGSPQWDWHYDESLNALQTGRFFLANWREAASG